VGVGACLITLAGAYGFAEMGGADRNPLTLSSYIISSIGFLGAGAILRHGTTVRGLTTAATLWSVAGVGIAVGAGLGGLATAAVLLILFTLVPLKRLEARLPIGPATHSLGVHLSDEEGMGKVLVALGRMRLPVKRTTIVPGAGASASLRVEMNTALKPEELALLADRLTAMKSVDRVETALLNVDDEQPRQGVPQFGTRRVHPRRSRRGLPPGDGPLNGGPPAPNNGGEENGGEAGEG